MAARAKTKTRKAKAKVKAKPPVGKKKPAPAAKAKKPAAKAKKSAAKAKKPAAKAKAKPAAKPAKKLAARKPPTAPSAPRRARKATSQLSLPGFSDDTGDGDGDVPSRAAQIAQVAAARASVDPGAPVRLGTVTAPSGTLAIFDVALMGYLPRAALDPLMVCADAPRDRPLAVIGTRVGKGRFADCWDHVAIELTGGEPTRARKLGEAAVDFARLLVIDRAAIDHWQHEDSLDELADFVFWGRDEAALAKAMGARRLPDGHHGWRDLPLADAEARADRAAELKAEHGWQLASEVRPHSHHFAALAAAREAGHGAGGLEIGGARALLFFTSWGDGVFPVFLDLDPDDRPVRVRIQLAPGELG